jgi:flagellar biosynthesis component FlhA
VIRQTSAGSGGNRRMKRILNNAVSLCVVVIVLFLIIPLPTAMIDILLVVNIGLSIMILMITMNISEALVRKRYSRARKQLWEMGGKDLYAE